MSSTVMYKTTEAQRKAQAKYIRKNKEKSNVWCKRYYNDNKQRILASRKVKYAEKKALKLASKNKLIQL